MGSQVTKVTDRWRAAARYALVLMGLTLPAQGQDMARPQTADQLYTQLRSVGLDRNRVYQIREAAIDRNSLHISMQDGLIAFTSDVCGRITGAFFEGDGEVLLRPPNKVERASLALFTGMAILEEQFSTAYFRFNDDTFQQLEPALRPAENGEQLIAEFGDTARRLSEMDALRLLLDFSRYLPGEGDAKPADDRNQALLHARLQGHKLGPIDLYYDASVPESIWAAQLRTVDQVSYVDVWTSFVPRNASVKGPPPTSSRRDDVTVRKYAIDAGVRPPTELDADARLQIEVLRGGQRALLFELSRFLNVRSVESQGKKLEFIHNQALEGTQLARRGNDLIAVVFPRPLEAGEKIDLRFVYGGEVISEAGPGLLYVGARGTWYPNLGLAMSNFDLEFHYPSEWTLVATGKATKAAEGVSHDAEILAAGTQVARWVSERPIPVAGFNLGKYERAVATNGKIEVEAFATTEVEKGFPKATELVPMPDVRRPNVPSGAVVVTSPPPSPARNAQAVADQSMRSLKFFADRFGPYPYSSLALTQLPGDLSQGWPGLVFLSSYAFLTDAERQHLRLDPVESVLSSQVLVHEIAHQWWGDLIAWRGYRDQWWVEGLSNYSSLMMLESENPAQFRAVLNKYRDNLFLKNKDGETLKDAGPVTFGGRLSSSRFPDGYEGISYGRGTWLFHMLRSMLREADKSRSGIGSDDLFLRGLQRLRQRFQGRLITSEEVISAFEDELPPSLRYEGKPSLSWFVSGWVNGTAVPKISLQNWKLSEKGESFEVTGKIEQEDAPSDLVTPVPVYGQVKGSNSLVSLGLVFADSAETTFHFTTTKRIAKVVLDPNQSLLLAK